MRTINFSFFLISLLSISFLASCHRTKLPIEEDGISNVNLQPRLLYGNWQLSMMLTNEPLDLDGDGTGNANLLLETDCFDDMRIEFFEDQTFLIENAQINFAASAVDKGFECLNGNESAGTWEVELDLLILSSMIDDEVYTETKVIKLTGNRFTFEVTKAESDRYLNDPGNTLDPDIQILELEYSRNN